MPGVQKKLSLQIHLNEKNSPPRMTIVGALSGQFILKPPTQEYPFMPELECLTMQLAKICGIEVAKHGLVLLKNDGIAYVTKRFDRMDEEKIACEDLCQLSELMTDQKYKSTAERTAKIIKKYSSYPGDDLLRYLEVTIFSFLTGNADMHLKNFSLITTPKNIIRLSPAYDLLATRLLISEKEDSEELVLSVNGKKSNLKRKDFEILSENIGIPKKTFQFIMNKFLSKKNELSKIIEKSFIPKNMQKEYLEMIAERSDRLKF
nr:HipA domain-containing protein [Silvanigrella aquatica]